MAQAPAAFFMAPTLQAWRFRLPFVSRLPVRRSEAKMDYTTLVSVNEVAAHLGDANWIVCDCRHDLAQYDAGRMAYAQSHIPGARFLHLDEDLSGPKTGVNGRHPLPHPITFTLRLAAIGIDNRKQVVAYDSAGAGGVYAARLWWMLRWVGHTRAAVLDGGFDAWVRAGLPVTAELPVIQAATYNPDPQPQRTMDTRAIAANLGSDGLRIVDARSPDRFRGENSILWPAIFPAPSIAFSNKTCARMAHSNPRPTSNRRSRHYPAACPRPPWCINAAPASLPATTCWPWKWPVLAARACTRVRGANG
jgi:3-mercaptopyruvate sulfurtransferase SseA